MEDRFIALPITPPPTAPLSDFGYPQVAAGRLANGLQILTVEDPYIPKVSVHMGLRIGKIHSPQDNAAVWPMALELIREGTEKRGSQEIARILDYHAIGFEAEALTEHSFLYMSALRSEIRRGLELLAEMLRFPNFPEQEVARVASQWQSMLLAQRAVASYLGRERMLTSLFGDHAYARVTIQPAHLKKIDRETLLKYYVDRISPSLGTLLFAGAISHTESMTWAEEFFGDWSAVSGEEIPLMPPPAPRPRIVVVARPHSQQARLIVAGAAFGTGHPDEHPFRVANSVLGGGGSARLFLNLRERKGYTYGIYSRGQFHKSGGLAAVSADFPPHVISEARQEILSEMSRLATEAPTAQEMELAQASLTARLLFQMETPASRGHLELIRRLYDLPPDYYRSYVDRILRVTPEEAAAAAARYFDPRRFLTVAVGDREALQEQLGDLGPVEVFDSEGARIAS